MANKINFTQGDTPEIIFNLTLNGEVVDLGGYEALFTMTKNPSPSTDSDADIQLNYTFPPGGTQAVFQTTETQTARMKPNVQYYWSLKLKDPSSTYFSTVLSGTGTVKQSYTQRTS